MQTRRRVGDEERGGGSLLEGVMGVVTGRAEDPCGGGEPPADTRDGSGAQRCWVTPAVLGASVVFV